MFFARKVWSIAYASSVSPSSGQTEDCGKFGVLIYADRKEEGRKVEHQDISATFSWPSLENRRKYPKV